MPASKSVAKRVRITVVAAVALAAGLPLQATEYSIPMTEWAPWTIKPAEPNGPLTGVVPELSNALLANLSTTPTPQITSLVRAQEGMEAGQWTWIFFYCAVDNPNYHKFNGVLFTLDSAFYVNTDSAFKKSTDLVNARVAVAGRPQFLLPEQSKHLQFEIINTIPQGFTLLQRRRVDAVLTGVGVAYWLSQHKEIPALKNFRILRIPEARADLCLFGHIKTPLSDRQIVQERLQRMQANGEIKAIYERYIGKH